MKKEIFFKNLNEQLAKKYNTTPQTINYIRSRIISFGFTHQSLIEHRRKKLRHARINYRDEGGLERCAAKLKFINRLTKSQFNDIIQLTEFDKKSTATKREPTAPGETETP